MIRDERWEHVKGGIRYDDIFKGRRLEITVRRHDRLYGYTYILLDRHPGELPYALDKVVYAMDGVLPA